MIRKILLSLLCLGFFFESGHLKAAAEQEAVQLGGYMRISTRPDFEGGDGKLGFWNLYGRLLNETSYLALESRIRLLKDEAENIESDLFLKIEGDSLGYADGFGGSLDRFRLSQAYLRVKGALSNELTFRIGTLESFEDDLSLYDVRPATILGDTIGALAEWNQSSFTLLFGAGDAGYQVRGQNYYTVLSLGGAVRFNLLDNLRLAFSGQYRHEPKNADNPNAPHATEGIKYEDFIRGEVTKSYFEELKPQVDYLPSEAREAASWKAATQLSFSGIWKLVYGNIFLSYEKKHPDSQVRSELYQWTDKDSGQAKSQKFDLYLLDITDERFMLNIGGELLFSFLSGDLETAFATWFGKETDNDNKVFATEEVRSFRSFVSRVQYSFIPNLSFLVEASLAKEISDNGNLFRKTARSIFKNDNGVADARGLENGDLDHRDTLQLKLGLVLSPDGSGILSRPAFRLLYGFQKSNISNAFGNKYRTDLNQNNQFPPKDRYNHQVIALEAETWF